MGHQLARLSQDMYDELQNIRTTGTCNEIHYTPIQVTQLFWELFAWSYFHFENIIASMSESLECLGAGHSPLPHSCLAGHWMHFDIQTPGCSISQTIGKVHWSATPYNKASRRPA